MLVIVPMLKSRLNILSAELFDMAGRMTATEEILLILTIIFFLWIIRRLIVFWQSILQIQILKDIRLDIKQKIFSSLIKLDISNFNSSVNGRYITMLTSEVEILEKQYYVNIIHLFSDVCSIVVLSISFFSLQRTMAIIIFIVGFIAMLIPILSTNIISSKTLAYTERLENFTEKLKEFFSTYSTIKNYGAENQVLNIYNIENRNVEERKFDSETTMAIVNNIGAFFAWFMQFIAVVVGIILVLNGEITIGVVIAAQEFAGDLGMPFQTIIQRISSIRSVKLLLRDINKVIYEKQKEDTENSIENIDIKNLKFVDVTLKINNKIILDRFNFEFKKGKKYLIIGQNGSGKSSLFKIVKRGFQSYEGIIQIDERDIKELSSLYLSSKISYLREYVDIFTATVEDNIRMFKEEDIKRCQEIADKVQLNLDMNRLIRGEDISSGEKRRIEIARSLYGMADILIFDEVISTLDIETAFEIEAQALGLENKTVIVISHNFSGKLLKKYDEIIIMNEGKLIDSGSYDYLIDTNEYFRNICEIKFGEWGK